MKKSFIYKAALAMMLIACFSLQSAAQSGVDVAYEIVNRYFVHQEAKKGTLKLVIKSQEEVEKVFGVSFIGPMSPIDFDRYFIIAVVVPKEIAQARVKPMSLKRDGNKLRFSYAIDVNDRTDMSNRSYVAILVDRKEPTKVEFQEVSTTGGSLQNEPKDSKSLRDQLKYVQAENELLKRQVLELDAQKDALQRKLADTYEKMKAMQREIDQLKTQLHP